MIFLFARDPLSCDERNLKRAVNRYGTMPKDARIGAYLESLRTSGMTPEPPSDGANTASDGGASTDNSLDRQRDILMMTVISIHDQQGLNETQIHNIISSFLKK